MPIAPTPSHAPTAQSAEHWRVLEDTVREACVLRAEGREALATAIVQDRLPELIGQWSRGAGLARERCQQELRELFARVQQQVTTATICKRLVLQSVDPQAPRGGEASAPVHISRRVPIDDIPGMLDALDEGERTVAFRRQHFQSTARRPQTALTVG